MPTAQNPPLAFRSPPVAPLQAVWGSFAAMCLAFVPVSLLGFGAYLGWRLLGNPPGPLTDALAIYTFSIFFGVPLAGLLTAPVAAIVCFQMGGLLSVAAVAGLYSVGMFLSLDSDHDPWAALASTLFLWPYPLFSWLFFWYVFAPKKEA